jgi:hypothetical protein
VFHGIDGLKSVKDGNFTGMMAVSGKKLKNQLNELAFF